MQLPQHHRELPVPTRTLGERMVIFYQDEGSSIGIWEEEAPRRLSPFEIDTQGFGRGQNGPEPTIEIVRATMRDCDRPVGDAMAR